MIAMLQALTLSGSVRFDSQNALLARAMGKKLAQVGAEVNNVDLADYELTLFNADQERSDGEPENAVKLAHLFTKADIIFIASPEYNGSLSPLLKNTIDWISRQKVAPFRRAIFGIGAASPGKMGGVSGLKHLRDILTSVGGLVAPASLGVGNSSSILDKTSLFMEENTNKRADNLVTQLISISRN